MKTLYLDCYSGIAGDMLLGALIDAGLDIKLLKKELDKLNLKGYKITAKKILKKGISATKFVVEITQKQHHERNIQDIFSIIDKSSLSEQIKQTSKKIFSKIADAESKIHNIPREKVHFHEIGAIDSIIDIVGTAIALNILGIEKIHCSEIPLGNGFVEFSHGKWPIPAPATAEILKGIPVYKTNIEHELVTPTGAAIISTLSEKFGEMPNMKISSIGYGAGSAEFEIPNTLRIFIGESDEKSEHISVNIIETNIDDMNPQFYDYVMEKLFAEGALDVFLQNIQMKKNRPGILLKVISPAEKTESLANIILKETTAIGVRISQAKRICLDREIVKVKTKFGEVRVKIAKSDGKIVNAHPEYDDCVKIAREKNVPLKKVYEIVLKDIREIFKY